MPSSHLILCCPLLLLPPIPPGIRVFSNESTLHMRWPKYWSFSFSIIPPKEIPGLTSFRPIIWFLFPHLTYPGTLPLVRIHPSAKVDLKVKDSGGRKFIMVWHYSLTFDPEGGFLHKCQFSSVQFSFSVVSNSLRPHESQHTRPPCPSPTPGVHSDSCPSSP